MPPTAIARSAPDVLALIPATMGFTPERSVVIIARRGRRGDAVMRVDLPGDASVTTRKRLTTSLIGMLCKIPDVDGILVAIFSDASARSELPHADFALHLSRRIEQSGFTLIDSLCQAADGWGSYCDPRLPLGGHSLAEIEASAARLSPFLPEAPSETGETLEATPQQRASMKRQLAHIRALAAALGDADGDGDGDGQTPEALRPLDDVLTLFEECLDWGEGDVDAHGALLLFVLQGPPMRDTAMLQWASNRAVGEVLFDECVRFRDEGLDLENPISVALADFMMGRGPRPDRVRIERAIGVLLLLVARADDAERPPVLSMLAWLNWALGRGSRAGEFIDRAQAIDPDYGLAELLHTMLGIGLLPEWIFSPPDTLTAR